MITGGVLVFAMIVFMGSTKSEVERNENGEIVEYVLIVINNATKGNKVVNSYIGIGWQPYGVPMYHNDRKQYIQTMVKYK